MSAPSGIVNYIDVMLALRDAGEMAHRLVPALEADAIAALCETALNVILGNIPSSPQQLARLRQHRKDLLAITTPNSARLKRSNGLSKAGVVESVLDVAGPALEGWRRR